MEDANVEPELPQKVPTIVGENDSARIRALGFDVNDDDEPPNWSITSAVAWNGIDYRKSNNHYEMSAQMKGNVGGEISDFSILDWFLRFLPRQYIASQCLDPSWDQ